MNAYDPRKLTPKEERRLEAIEIILCLFVLAWGLFGGGAAKIAKWFGLGRVPQSETEVNCVAVPNHREDA